MKHKILVYSNKRDLPRARLERQYIHRLGHFVFMDAGKVIDNSFNSYKHC